MEIKTPPIHIEQIETVFLLGIKPEYDMLEKHSPYLFFLPECGENILDYHTYCYFLLGEN